jgi:hypothetical protein
MRFFAALTITNENRDVSMFYPIVAAMDFGCTYK